MNHIFLGIVVLLAPVIGGISYGIERKVKARMQNRIGPGIWQPFYDFFKLAGKRQIMVHSAHAFFGIIHFLSIWLAVGVLIFGGDLILVVFLHLLSTALLIVGGFSTRSVFSHLGANRSALSILAYEPVLIIIAVSIYVITGSFDITSIFAMEGPLLYRIPLAFIALLMVLPVKLKKSPFDISEAHQEVVGGTEIEYSGLFYGVIHAAKWLDYVFCYSLVYLFAGNNWMLGIALVIGTFLFINALDNSTARVDYRQMLKFSFSIALPAAFINLLFTLFTLG